MTARLSEAECWDLLSRMFPHGLEDEALAREIGPGRWQHLRPDELGDLLGRCLWDVFADNHELTTREGAVVDLGSFRGAAGFIADFRGRHGASERAQDRSYGYLDFYMGSLGIEHRDGLLPIYRMIFTRMHRLGLDWRYVYPRLYLIDFGEHVRDESVERYDPSEAVARELERQRHDEETADLKARLDEDHRRSVQEARQGPPPVTVRAYRDVYERFPAGWPPELTS